jgi:hypothetical protein
MRYFRIVSLLDIHIVAIIGIVTIIRSYHWVCISECWEEFEIGQAIDRDRELFRHDLTFIILMFG